MTTKLYPLALLTSAALAATQPTGPARWEPDIRKFEAADKAAPPPRGGVLFVGSSTIRMWPTARSFPDLVTLNRGFGGSAVRDSVAFAERIILPYRPRVIVFYAGDNDIAGGTTPQRVCDDFKALLAKVQPALPATRIIFLGIKPSVARWKLWPKMQEANRLVRAAMAGDPRLVYVDTAPTMLNDQGQPRSELLRADGLHLNDEGYRRWTALVRPLLVEKKVVPAGRRSQLK